MENLTAEEQAKYDQAVRIYDELDHLIARMKELELQIKQIGQDSSVDLLKKLTILLVNRMVSKL